MVTNPNHIDFCKRWIYWAFGFVALLPNPAQSQFNINQLERKINLEHTYSLQKEDVFIHTDRVTYLSGETIWYKIYDQNLRSRSQNENEIIVYLEVMDRNAKVITRGINKIGTQGFMEGSLKIPLNAQTDNYYLRIYTGWMKNFQENSFIHHLIPIINPLDAKSIRLEKSDNLEINLMPESGKLISDFESKVVFNINSLLAEHVLLQGKLIDTDGKTILNLDGNSQHSGSFNIVPQSEKNYEIEFTLKDSTVISKKLPPVDEYGFQIIVDQMDSSDLIINVNWNFIFVTSKKQDEKLSLIALNRTKTVLIDQFVPDNANTKSIQINKSLFGTGPVKLLLYNDQNELLCSRPLLVSPIPTSEIQIKVDQLIDVRSTSTIELIFNDEYDSLANYSVSIHKIFPKFDSTEIITLNLPVYSSNFNAFYFTQQFEKNEKEKSNHYIDDQMLVRFNPLNTNFSIGHDPVYFPETIYPILQGKLLNRENKPIENEMIWLSVEDSIAWPTPVVTNDQGEFKIKIRDYKKLATSTFQYPSPTQKNLFLDELFSSQPLLSHPPFLYLTTAEMEMYRQRFIHSLVETHFDQSTENKSSTSNYSFYGIASKTYHLEDYVRFESMEETFREYMSELIVRKTDNQINLRIMNGIKIIGENPLLLLNGKICFAVDQLMSIDPFQVKKVDIITEKYQIGKLKYDGIISVFTFKQSTDPDIQNPLFQYRDLITEEKFNPILYSEEIANDSRKPDTRYLLLWIPINATNNKSQVIKFSTSDIPGMYVIDIKGFTKSGKLINKQTFFEVIDRSRLN